MAITYPLTMPGYPSPASLRITQQNSVAMSASPFTGAQQVQEWPGEWWEAEWSLPPLTDEQAGVWRGFLGALRGQSGSFLMGPGALMSPRGTLGDNTNLLMQSEALTDTGYWSGFAVGASNPTVTANQVQNPFSSGVTAEKIVFPSTTPSALSEWLQIVPALVIAGQVFTASIWLRSDVPVTVNILLNNQRTADRMSATQPCQLTTTWQRFSVSVQFAATMARDQVGFAIQAIGQATATIYAWGAQLERGVMDPSDYQVTGARAFIDTNSAGFGPGSKTVTVSFPPAGVSFRAGDWFQIGSHLYLATADATTGARASNQADVEIYPRLRSDATNAQQVFWIDPVGLWRLAENPRSWGLSPGLIYDFSGIKCREVL